MWSGGWVGMFLYLVHLPRILTDLAGMNQDQDCWFQAPWALTDLAGMNQDQDHWFQAPWAQGHWESHQRVVHLCDRDWMYCVGRHRHVGRHLHSGLLVLVFGPRLAREIGSELMEIGYWSHIDLLQAGYHHVLVVFCLLHHFCLLHGATLRWSRVLLVLASFSIWNVW